jgi:uncharacterized protein (TIGR03083 family)
MDFSEMLALVDERSIALRAAVAVAPDLEARVPKCPDWTLRDLVAHVGMVHRFWAVIVRTGEADGPPSREILGDTEPHGDLLEWSAESTRLLLAALSEAGPDSPCWTWWPMAEAPQTSGAVARHQIQEAAVHAWDAQDTIGKPEPIPAAPAVDGVAEFLQVTYGAEGPWPHRPARIVFACTEGPAWTLDLTPSGARLDPPAGGEPLATVHGPASEILLTLFSRIPLESPHIDGDEEVVRQLLAWGDTA